MYASLGMSHVCGLMLHFRELKILRKLESVSKVTQLICYDVVYSQEGALVMINDRHGEGRDQPPKVPREQRNIVNVEFTLPLGGDSRMYCCSSF